MGGGRQSAARPTKEIDYRRMEAANCSATNVSDRGRKKRNLIVNKAPC